MNKPTTLRTESILNLQLSEEAHALIRDLAMACRKTSIYGVGHPLAQKAVEKPFFGFASIFRYKSYVNLNVRQGDLYLLNIRLKDSPFNAQILQFLQVLDVNAVLFRSDMRVQDFAFFIETLVQRQLTYDAGFSFTSHFANHKVSCIEVNTELAFDLFEKRRQYRGDVDGDFSVRRLALDQLGDDPLRLAQVRNANAQGLLDLGIDFDPELIGYLVPERMAAFDASQLKKVLTELADLLSSASAGPKKTSEASNAYMSLFRLMEYHPDKKKILENFEERKRQAEGGVEGDKLSKTGAIKIMASAEIDQLIEKLFSASDPEFETEPYADAFARLLKTGQQPKACDSVTRLMDLMSSPDPVFRQRALNLLASSMQDLAHATDPGVLVAAVDSCCERLANKTETYEYSEFFWLLFETCHAVRQYAAAAKLTEAMAARRNIIDNVTVYDSMAVKKGFENISRKATVDRLIRELITAASGDAAHLRDILVAIGSEEIALALSHIISHPQRSVRQLTLKILAELGKSSLKVFSSIVYDDHLFERDDTRCELSFEQWYVIRNSIFVLGSLHDEQGIAPLRARIADKDVRVRREIVSALEKIGGEDAIDCLTLMADDQLQEVSDASIIAIGLIGNADTAPLLLDIARRNPKNAIKAVTGMGKLGGGQAREFLGQLLSDSERLAELAGGVTSKDELRVAAVKALGQIGDADAIDHIRSFKESQSTAAKILFKNSTVNKAISEILARH